MQSKSCRDYKKRMCPQRLSSYLGHAHKKKQKEHKRFERHTRQPTALGMLDQLGAQCLPPH